jgi:uncharacterized protein
MGEITNEAPGWPPPGSGAWAKPAQNAIGAIGVARAFAFGGRAGQTMHDPGTPARPHTTAEAYLSRDGTTINHFHEKLLLLSDRLNTVSARQVARRRHEFLENFLSEFLAEWDASDVSAGR